MTAFVRRVRDAACATSLLALFWTHPGLADDVPPPAAAEASESAELPGAEAATDADATPPAASEAADRSAAEAAGAAEAAAEAAGKPAPGPPVPPFAFDPKRQLKWDWVQINTGEWLKGKIKRMHRDTFYFDSDEFDEVDFDWKNVVTLVSRGVVTIRVENAQAITARIDMRQKVARMIGPGGIQEVSQHLILGMIPGTPSEKNYWSGGASLGAAVRSGNTDQADISLSANIVRQTELTRWRTTYTGQISTVDAAQTANSHRVPSQFDIYLTRRFFLSTPVFQYYTDQFQNLQSQITAGLGVGYEFVDNSWLFLEVDGGLAYQYTDYISVEAGEDPVDNDAAVFLKTTMNFDLPYGIEWDNLYSLQLVFTDFGKTSHHAESVLSFDLWGPIDFDLSFIFDRIENPVPNSDGTRPESNDYRLTAGLGIDF